MRPCSSKALTPCTMLRIRRQEMVRTLSEQPAMSRVFIKYLLSRNTRIQADLVDQLFNSSEKRLARTLLLLSQTGRQDMPLAPLPKISQATLADMVGTTRSRVSFFMNRFRKLGFINYNGRIQIHKSLLNVVLHDESLPDNAKSSALLEVTANESKPARRMSARLSKREQPFKK